MFFCYANFQCSQKHNNNNNNNNNYNLLLTEREGRTGEYWPEVVCSARMKATEGQYSPVRLEQARLVSSLLYGTLFFIVKCTSGGLHLKMFVFSIYLWNFGKISIFIASSDSFNVKNDNIHTFFSLFWLQILNLPASLQNKNTRIGPFPWKWSVLQNPDQERTNQSTGICRIIIHLIPKWRPINYSFVCMFISPLCLIFTSKFVFSTCWRGIKG